MRCLRALERQRRDHPLFRVMTKAKPLPPVELVRELLDYNQETGELTWKSCRASNAKPGDTAGSLHDSGYIRVSINKVYYRAHRLIWLYVTGSDPLDSQIDHIDGDKTNNCFCNLRKANNSQNQHNTGLRLSNGSGYKGVDKRNNRWRARIRVNNKRLFLGCFDTPELAHMAYAKAAAELHGEFARAA